MDSPFNITRLQPDYSQQCYDATWTLARGLNEVVKSMCMTAAINFSNKIIILIIVLFSVVSRPSP